MNVPFFRPDLSSAEVDEVVAALRSGWLTTGPRVRQFETKSHPPSAANTPWPSIHAPPRFTWPSRRWG